MLNEELKKYNIVYGNGKTISLHHQAIQNFTWLLQLLIKVIGHNITLSLCRWKVYVSWHEDRVQCKQKRNPSSVSYARATFTGHLYTRSKGKVNKKGGGKSTRIWFSLVLVVIYPECLKRHSHSLPLLAIWRMSDGWGSDGPLVSSHCLILIAWGGIERPWEYHFKRSYNQ